MAAARVAVASHSMGGPPTDPSPPIGWTATWPPLVIGRQHKLACVVRGDADGPRFHRDGPVLRESAGGRGDREAGDLWRVTASSIQKLAIRADRQGERPAGHRDLHL